PAASATAAAPHQAPPLALLRPQLLQPGDDPSDGHHLAVAPALQLGQGRIGLAPELVADGRQRMLGHVEPERLLLQPQQLVLLELLRTDRRRLRPPLPPAEPPAL